MSVMWKYLDKKAAAIRALEDYSSMQFIIENTDNNMKAVREDMTSVGSPRWDGMPRVHSPQAGEEHMADAIDKIDLMKERYRQAVEYMAWFKPAWEKLSDDERYVLETFFVYNHYGAKALATVCTRYGIEENSAYKKRSRATEHLTLLLYGKD